MMIKIKCMKEPGAIIPAKGREGDSCFDLFTYKEAIIHPFETIVIPTGIRMEIPYGYEGAVRPRSGISLKGLNGTYARVIFGTVDSNYRGDIGIIVYNDSDGRIIIPEKTRLAQLAIQKVPEVELVEAEEIGTDTTRGHEGFGSSGLK